MPQIHDIMLPDLHQLITAAQEAAEKAREMAERAQAAVETRRQEHEETWRPKTERRESVLHLFEARQEARHSTHVKTEPSENDA